MPGLLDIIGGLDDGIRCAITTNLSHSVLDLVQRVSPSRLVHITCSFHPTQNGTHSNPMNVETFTGRVLFDAAAVSPTSVSSLAVWRGDASTIHSTTSCLSGISSTKAFG